MTHDEFVQRVIDRWDETRAEGAAFDPREICRSDPELSQMAAAHPELLDRVEDEIAELTVGGNMVELARVALRTVVSTPSSWREAPRLAVGTKVTIENTYAVQEVSADGGQGVVYRMHNLDLKSSVSAKLLHVDPTRSQFDGVTAAAQFNHPGIPFVVGCGETEEGQPIYLMRLIEGQDFSESLRAHRHDLRRNLYDFASVCNTAHFAHERGAVHCDIKPRNIRVGENGGEVVLLDWDTAVSIDPRFRAPSSYFTRGTPGYAAPEMLCDAPPSPSRQVDIYSLGAVLYEVLSGEKPKGAQHNAAALRRVRGALRPLASIVAKAMQVDPAKRYETAHEVAEEVTRWLEGREVRAHRYRPTERVWAAIKRPTTVSKIMLTAASVLFLGMVAALFVVRSQNQHLEASERDGLRVSARLCADYVGRQFQDRWTFLESVAERIVSDDTLLADLTSTETGADALHASRLQSWIRDNTLGRPEAPQAASCFVLNKDGIQIAKLTRGSSSDQESTLGHDFHDRPYFLGKDGHPIATLSISSAYKSSSTDKTRIAFSLPIRRQGQFLGVIGVSADVRGDVRFLPPWLRDDDVVTVVDLKATDDDLGTRAGAFLVHPSYTQAIAEGQSEPTPLFESPSYLERYEALRGRRYNQLSNASEAAGTLPFLDNYEKAYLDQVRLEPFRMAFEPVILEYAGTLVDTGLVVKIQRR